MAKVLGHFLVSTALHSSWSSTANNVMSNSTLLPECIYALVRLSELN